MEGGEGGGVGAADAADSAPVVEVVQSLQALLEPWSEPEYMLLLHVRIAREEAAKRGAPALGVDELADVLRRLGYAVRVVQALGGGTGGACLRSLRHTFLTVGVGGGGGHMSYVVDPRFREQVRRGRWAGGRCACALTRPPAWSPQPTHPPAPSPPPSSAWTV